jgi:hypothetical protein
MVSGKWRRRLSIDRWLFWIFVLGVGRGVCFLYILHSIVGSPYDIYKETSHLQ